MSEMDQAASESIKVELAAAGDDLEDDEDTRTVDLYAGTLEDAPFSMESSTGNLSEAMRQLSPWKGKPRMSDSEMATHNERAEASTFPPKHRDRSLRIRIMERPSPEGGLEDHPAGEPYPYSGASTADQVDVALLLQELKNVSSNVQGVNASVEKLAALAGRVEKIEELLIHGMKAPSKRVRKRPYPTPNRKEEEAKKFAKDIRSEIDSLLDAHDEPFATGAEVKRFELIVKEFPEQRCCTITNFKIDLNGGPRSPWNVSSALVFTEHYLITSNIPSDKASDVTNTFLTRVKSIKGSSQLTDQVKLNKSTYVRKYNLFHRRAEIIVEVPYLQEHMPLLQALSIDGMSSDEEDGGGSGDMKVPTYQVLTPRWRSQELTLFLHILDSFYILWRRLDPDRQRGGWPRTRRYDAKNVKLSKKATYPKNLPRNAYREDWLNAFPNVSLSVNPGPGYKFVHSPETFRYLSGGSLSVGSDSRAGVSA